MNKFWLLSPIFLLILASPDASAQPRGGFSPDDFFNRLDTNQDGKIDQKEAGEARGPMSDMLTSAIKEAGGPIDKEKFRLVMEKARESFSRSRGRSEDRRESDSGGGPRFGPPPGGPAPSAPPADSGSQPGDSRRESRRESRESRDSKDKAAQKPRPKFVVELPADFVAADENRDGQIAFSEWRRWGARKVSIFDRADLNQDGYLTPQEIAKYPELLQVSLPEVSLPASAPPIAGVAAKPVAVEKSAANEKVDAPMNSAAAATATPSDAPVVEIDVSAVKDADAKIVEEASREFDLIDANEDGKLSAGEVKSSRKVMAMLADMNAAPESIQNREALIAVFQAARSKK